MKIKIINGLPYHFLLKHPAPAYIKGWLEKELDKDEFKVEIADYTSEWLRYLINKDPVNKQINQQKRAELIDKANEYLDNLPNIDFLKDFERIYSTKKSLENLIEEINKIKSDEKLEFTGNTFRYWSKKDFSYKKRETVMKALEKGKREDTIFFAYLNELSDKLVNEENDVIGFSISDNYQIIPTLTLTSLIKEKAKSLEKKEPKIVLGGDFISRRKEIFKQDDQLNRKFFDIIDMIYYGPGELSFHKSVEKLTKGEYPTSIGGVITRNNLVSIKSDKELYRLGEQMQNEILKSLNLDDSPAPKFSGLYDSKITPIPVPAIQSQRSCPEKCEFCGIGYNSKYAIMKAKHFTKHIEAVNKELGTNIFSLTDLTLYPKVYERIFDELNKKRINIEWDCYAEFDKKFEDKELVKQLATDGCRFIQFGLESVSEKTLDRMNKARTSKDQANVLKTTFNEGIWNMVFYITGFPGSTTLDDLAILPFLEENGQYILAIKPNVFKLSRGSPEAIKYQECEFDIRKIPKEEKILNIEKTGELDTNLLYTYNNDQSKKVSEAILRTVERWVKQRHRINIGYVLDNFDKKFFNQDELKILEQCRDQGAPLNEVVRTYVYHQRYFLNFEDPYLFAVKQFAKNIHKYNGDIREKIEKFWNNHYNKHSKISHYGKNMPEEKDNKTIYNAIIGNELLEVHRKYTAGNEKLKQKMEKYYNELKEKNKAGTILLEEFSDGFKNLDDVIRMIYRMREEKLI